MENIPNFLIMLKSNSLIYSILLSGNLSLIKTSNYNFDFFSDRYVEVYSFSLSEDDIFEKISLEKNDDDTSFILKSKTKKYIEQAEMYFGSKTVYSDYLNDLEFKKIRLKHPLTYEYKIGNKTLDIRIIELTDGCKIIGSVSN